MKFTIKNRWLKDRDPVWSQSVLNGFFHVDFGFNQKNIKNKCMNSAAIKYLEFITKIVGCMTGALA